MHNQEGWRWWQPARAGESGWYWWDSDLRCLGPAHPFEIDLPRKKIQKVDLEKGQLHTQSFPLFLADSIPRLNWVEAWWDGHLAWAIAPATGPTPARSIHSPPSSIPERILQAVKRGGGSLEAAEPIAEGWRVHWTRSGVHYQSKVDDALNVLEAGFCLSGQDRIQDLTSLVSLVEGRESRHADPYMWGGHAWS